MHELLEKLFLQRGIKNTKDLSPEEREDFDRSNAILSKEGLEVKDIKKFCEIQIAIIKQKWGDYNINSKEKGDLVPYFTVYSSILGAMDGPRVAREAEEKRLEAMLK